MVNFIQVVYLFKFTTVHSEGMYHFLNGFGFGHVLFWPNFVYGVLGQGYRAYPAERALVPDGNFIRNAGSSLSFMAICVIVLGIASLVSYILYRTKNLP